MNQFIEGTGKFFHELQSELLEVMLAITVLFQLFFVLIELPKNKDYSALVSQPLWNKIKLSTLPIRNKLKNELIQIHKKYPVTNTPDDLGLSIAVLLVFMLSFMNMILGYLVIYILSLFIISHSKNELESVSLSKYRGLIQIL